MARPDPIPNSAVKHRIADGSACIACARVGSRRTFQTTNQGPDFQRSLALLVLNPRGFAAPRPTPRRQPEAVPHPISHVPRLTFDVHGIREREPDQAPQDPWIHFHGFEQVPGPICIQAHARRPRIRQRPFLGISPHRTFLGFWNHLACPCGGGRAKVRPLGSTLLFSLCLPMSTPA